MQTNPAVEQSKIIRWSESPWKQSGRKGKGLRRKGFAVEPSLEFRMKCAVRNYWGGSPGGGSEIVGISYICAEHGMRIDVEMFANRLSSMSAAS